ncbi:hypothetical protein FF38_04283 [Lucilia cuprina]|uniref:Uncharacterized protein n=1 Tax=Lucilia cuprina TaxID=7375 RepID=A0A0L0CP66_LUCCU|nr:hypothetical protein FF38_04283 [Lucilia cuprina]
MLKQNKQKIKRVECKGRMLFNFDVVIANKVIVWLTEPVNFVKSTLLRGSCTISVSLRGTEITSISLRFNSLRDNGLLRTQTERRAPTLPVAMEALLAALTEPLPPYEEVLPIEEVLVRPPPPPPPKLEAEARREALLVVRERTMPVVGGGKACGGIFSTCSATEAEDKILEEFIVARLVR